MAREQSGLPVVDADLIAKEIVQPGRGAYAKLVAHFGPEILVADGKEIDKAKLGAIVFNDEKERKVLNGITHSVVGKEMAKAVAWAFLAGHPGVILDVPLLFEAKMDRWCSASVVIYLDREQQLARLHKRNPDLGEEAEKRIDAQMDIEEKARRATHVIDNCGSEAATLAQVKALVAAGHLPRSTAARRLLRLSVGAVLLLAVSAAAWHAALGWY